MLACTVAERRPGEPERRNDRADGEPGKIAADTDKL